MIHHSDSDYATAKSEAARQARPKLEKMIEDGRAKARPVVEQVLSRVIADKVVKTAKVEVFRVSDNDAPNPWRLQLPGHMTDAVDVPGLHGHAFSQVLGDAGIDKRFADRLEAQANGTDWGANLLAHNVNTIFSHRDKQRNLVREEDGVVKGWLSDRFRRIDSRPLLEQFVASCDELGLVPVDGVASDTRARLRAVFPKVFEPIADEVMVFFLEWGNSDYGHGGHVVNLGVVRLVCTNFAVAEQRLRQVHVGGRLADDIRFSEETYNADTRANVLALSDVISDAISPDRLNHLCSIVTEAGEKHLKGTDVATLLAKVVTNKKDADLALAAYEGHDCVNLPAGNTAWRLSNALSWVAQRPDISADRRIELQEAAGSVFVPAKKMGKAVEV